jgi:hypothetical protein
MLAVAIQHHRPCVLLFHCRSQARLDCGAFARPVRPPDELRSCLDCSNGRFILGIIVHYEDQWKVAANSPYQFANADRLIAARDHSGAYRGPIHSKILSERNIPRSKFPLAPAWALRTRFAAHVPHPMNSLPAHKLGAQ